MNSDRELLELAAKAAGYKVGKDSNKYTQTDFDMCWSIANECMVFHHGDVGSEYPVLPTWNPLDDDGDALRLAIKLKLSIESDALIEVDYDKDFGGTYEYGCEVWIVHEDASATKAQQLYNNDAAAATRRAIVSCAAQLGEKK